MRFSHEKATLKTIVIQKIFEDGCRDELMNFGGLYNQTPTRLKIRD